MPTIPNRDQGSTVLGIVQTQAPSVPKHSLNRPDRHSVKESEYCYAALHMGSQATYIK